MTPKTELRIPEVRVRTASPTTALRRAVGSPLLAQILSARGIDDPELLRLDLDRLLPPEQLEGAPAAAALLEQALLDQQRICIVGDYDADGATSTTLAVHGLRALGALHVDFLIPDRARDGYGLTAPIAERAAATGAQLLVTVDNGTSSIDGVARARGLGMRVLITDHHLPGPELPAADVIVNPNLPGAVFPLRALAGVGVVFYVLLALRARLRAGGWFDAGRAAPNLAEYLDLVALGTVADVASLDANNRILVHQGLQRIRGGRGRPGIAALITAAKRSAERISEIDMGFAIAPRINAAGRLADMSLGVQCLLSTNSEDATRLAAALSTINADRQIISRDMVDHALELLDAAHDANAQGMVLFDEGWHEGIVGIVAGRVREVARTPVFAFAPAQIAEQDDVVLLRGSGRSIPEINLRDLLYSIDRAHPGLLIRFGGHAMAAGVTLTPARLAPFRSAFTAAVKDALAGAPPAHILESDGCLSDSDLSITTATRIAQLGPWGAGFPEPRFHDEFDVVHVRALTDRFFRLVLRRGDRLLEAVTSVLPPMRGARIGGFFRLSVNRYRGEESLQLALEQHWPA